MLYDKTKHTLLKDRWISSPLGPDATFYVPAELLFNGLDLEKESNRIGSKLADSENRLLIIDRKLSNDQILDKASKEYIDTLLEEKKNLQICISSLSDTLCILSSGGEYVSSI